MSRPGMKPVYIKDDLYKRLKIVAAFQEITITKFVDDAIKKYLPDRIGQMLCNELDFCR